MGSSFCKIENYLIKICYLCYQFRSTECSALPICIKVSIWLTYMNISVSQKSVNHIFLTQIVSLLHIPFYSTTSIFLFNS